MGGVLEEVVAKPTPVLVAALLVRQNSIQADVKTALDTVLWWDWVTSRPSKGATLIYVPARCSTAAGRGAHPVA